MNSLRLFLYACVLFMGREWEMTLSALWIHLISISCITIMYCILFAYKCGIVSVNYYFFCLSFCARKILELERDVPFNYLYHNCAVIS